MGIAPTSMEPTMEVITILRIADGKILERWAVSDMLGVSHKLGVALPPKPKE